MGNPYVHNLPPELLLKIVTLNANMFVDSAALKTTYGTSGVCKSWRDLLLASPSLWGRLIDIDILWQHLDTYLIEILSRSQGSPLWVKYEKQDYTLGYTGEHFKRFVTFLHSNWAQVQILTLTFRQSASSANLYNIFALPAPNIHTFNVAYSYDWQFINPVHHALTLTTLFSGEAPNLRVLKVNWFPPISNFPQIHRLHTLYIEDVKDMHGLLSLLKEGFLLRILHVVLQGHSTQSHTAPLPIASLPHLLFLVLWADNPAKANVMFDHLDLPVGVSLNCQIRSTNINIELLTRLSAFSRSYFEAHPPTRLAFSSVHNAFRFEDISGPGDEDRHFSIYFIQGQGFFNEADSERYFNRAQGFFHQGSQNTAEWLDALCSPCLSSTTMLLIDFWAMGQPVSAVKTFFASLPRVTRIAVCRDALQYLLVELQQEFDFWPGLTRCAMTLEHGPVGQEVFQKARSFLQLRALAGRPLTVFDITRLRDPDITNAVRILDVEELKDMRIRCKLGGGPGTEYVCGSGAPKPSLDPI